MHWRVFVLTWVSYASYYLCRKNFSVGKSALQEEHGLSTEALALVDTGYLAAYAIGLFVMGFLGDRLGPRRLIGLGMLASAGLVIAAGATDAAIALGVLFAVNGLAQATGWPGNVKAMAAWSSPADRGRVMGLWSTCYQVGGLVAGALLAALLKHWGWRASFFVPAAWVALWGAVVLLLLPEKPPEPASVRAAAARGVLTDPTLWSVGAAYFCLKLIRYSLLFWLPFYLEKSLGFARGDAGYQALAFEAGGVVGAITIGAGSDRFFRGRRALAGALGCAGLVGALVLYAIVGRAGVVPNFLALAAVGFLLFGPDSLISAAAAQDAGGPGATATAAGFINGLGSTGALLQGLLTATVAARWGWDRLFHVFVGLAALATITLLPRVFAERRRARAAHS